jgi:glycosyltransferase involved in cell wall biosynthesis
VSMDQPVSVRIGVDCRVLDDRYHGIGRATLGLLENLPEVPGRVLVLFMSRDQIVSRLDISALLGRGDIEVRDFSHGLSGVAQFFAWPGALRRARIKSVLFPYHLGASVFGRPRRYAIIHDCILEQERRFAPSATTRLLYMFLTLVVVWRVKLFSPSRASALAIERFYRRKASGIEILSWAVGDLFFHTADVPETIGPSSIPAKYLLHVGARRPHKNVDFLLSVLSLLPEEVSLVLVGDADPRWRDETDTIASSLGVDHRVVALSAVTEADLMGLYAGAHAYVYPSIVEGFGLPLLEAMAAGAPVIASRIDVFEEVVGDAAILLPLTDPASWSEAILGLDEPGHRAKMIEVGRRRARATSWRDPAAHLMRIMTSD